MHDQQLKARKRVRFCFKKRKDEALFVSGTVVKGFVSFSPIFVLPERLVKPIVWTEILFCASITIVATLLEKESTEQSRCVNSIYSQIECGSRSDYYLWKMCL